MGRLIVGKLIVGRVNGYHYNLLLNVEINKRAQKLNNVTFATQLQMVQHYSFRAP